VADPDPDLGLRPGAARVAPLRDDELDDVQRAVLAPYAGFANGVPDVLRTLVREPGLCAAWLPFAARLLNESAFDVRTRELVILRTAVLLDSVYEWAQHISLSRDVVAAHELDRLVEGPDAPGWTPAEATLLRAVDELVAHHGIADTTWAALREVLQPQLLVELPFLVGHYTMLAMAMHALGVQPEDASARLPRPAGGQTTRAAGSDPRRST
jgi:4-carboxymuconolactone decarboxylase